MIYILKPHKLEKFVNNLIKAENATFEIKLFYKIFSMLKEYINDRISNKFVFT